MGVSPGTSGTGSYTFGKGKHRAVVLDSSVFAAVFDRPHAEAMAIRVGIAMAIEIIDSTFTGNLPF
jgi:hypothetical protein